MFQKGEYVVSGSKGVCIVENITKLNLSGIDKEREYYILKPIYMSGSTIFVPVDTAEDTLRRVLSREQADELIKEIEKIPLIEPANEKLLEQEYKGCIRTNDCKDLVRIIKTIYARKQERLEAGRKVTAVDAKYFRLAEDNLYGELAVALKMTKNDVEPYIASHMHVGQ